MTKIKSDDLARQVREWEQRMEEKKHREEEEDKDRADRLRSDYLRRTKRDRCEP